MRKLIGFFMVLGMMLAVSQNCFAEVTVGGALEFDYSYTEPEEGGSISDFSVSTLDLNVDAVLNEAFTTTVVLTLGDANGIDLDEGYITVKDPSKSPLYLIMGRHFLPFGQYYTHTISDSFTDTAECDITDTGATLGAMFPDMLNLNVSVTGFRSDRLEDEESLNGVIGRVDICPMEGIAVGGGYLTDDVEDRINVFLEVIQGPFTVDGEMFMVTDTDLDEEEMMFSIGLAFQYEKTEFAVRYGSKTDTPVADDDGNVVDFQDQYDAVLGINYALYDNVTLMSEYRFVDMDDAEESILGFRCAVVF